MVAAIVAGMAVTLLLLLTAQEVHHWIGIAARKVVVRVFGVLLAALAVQSFSNRMGADWAYHEARRIFLSATGKREE